MDKKITEKFLDKDRKYTEQQLVFLRALGEETRGDIRRAMDIAGYSKTTSSTDMVNSLGAEMAKVAYSILAAHGTKAAWALVGVLDDPTKMGTDNVLKATKEILDRTGLAKKDDGPDSGPKTVQNVFILPEKKGTKISVEMEDNDSEGSGTNS